MNLVERKIEALLQLKAARDFPNGRGDGRERGLIARYQTDAPRKVGQNGPGLNAPKIEVIEQAVRNNGEQPGFDDVRIQRRYRIGFEYDIGLGCGAPKRRIDHLPVAHLPRQQAQQQPARFFPRYRSPEIRIAAGQQDIALIEQMQRLESVEGLFVEVSETQVQFEPVQAAGDLLGAQRRNAVTNFRI